jgi:hypothetical protein
METQAKENLRSLFLLKESLEGLASVLRKTLAVEGYSPSMSILFPAGVGEQREQQGTEGQVKYPYITILVNTVDKQRADAYNDSLRRVGKGVRHEDKVYAFKMIPVQLGLGLKFTTQSYAEALKFVETWMFAEMDSQFYLQSSTFRIHVKLIFGESVNIPEINYTDQANLFNVEVTLTMNTYVARMSLSPRITKVALTSQLNNSENDFTVSGDTTVYGVDNSGTIAGEVAENVE